MGKFRGKQVKCPKCGTVQYTEGSIYFVCCNKAFPIDQNLCAKEGGGTSDVIEKPVTSENPDKIEFIGGNEEMPDENEEEEFTCADCGTEVDKNQKFCNGCGKELNWS